MSSTNNRNLTLTQQGSNVKVKVTYNAVFTEFERHLAGLGLRFRERITLLGVDPPGSTSGTALSPFPAAIFPVTDGPGAQTIARIREITVPRATLQEDPTLGDNDELRCKIVIESVGFPPQSTTPEFTDQEILVG